MTLDPAVRRRVVPAIVALLASTLVVAFGPVAVARTVSRADIATAAEAVDQSASRLAEVRAALHEAEQAVARITATMGRLESQRAAAMSGTAEHTADLRERIARMYMVASSTTPLMVSDVSSLSMRVAYLTALDDSSRGSLNQFVVSARDLTGLLDAAAAQLVERQEQVASLGVERDGRLAEWETARSRLASVEAEWARQEAARIAAEEAELRRQEEELARGVTTTRPAGPTTTTTRPDYGYIPGAGVEQWRPIVTSVFAQWGLDRTKCATRNGVEFCVGPQIDNALKIIRCESNGVPFAENPRSGAAGLFQNLPYYWQSRVDRVRAYHSNMSSIPANASIWNPEYNTIVAALLVWESRETLLGNRGGGGVSPAVWPEFNWDRYATSGYGYSGWGKGPNPWGHWTCGSYVGAFDLSWVHPWATQQTPPG